MTRVVLSVLCVCCLAGCGEGVLFDDGKVAFGNIEAYRRRLEARLLQQHRNHPQYGDRVAVVEVVVSRDIEEDVTGTQYRAEFAQIVKDRWGERLPELEEEYFVVTFGPNGSGPRRRRADPSLDVGLDTSGYSEFEPVLDPIIRDAQEGVSESLPLPKFDPVTGEPVAAR